MLQFSGDTYDGELNNLNHIHTMYDDDLSMHLEREHQSIDFNLDQYVITYLISINT